MIKTKQNKMETYLFLNDGATLLLKENDGLQSRKDDA